MCESYQRKKDIYCFEVRVFDEILCLCCHRRREVSFIRFSGDLERTSVSGFLL